jgi:hypothetical protein
VVFCLLVVFYASTRPLSHSESYDTLNYVLFAENFPLGTAPDSRNILFHAVNRIVVVAADTIGANVGTLELLSGVSILTGAMSLILFVRLMRKHFGVSAFSAWAGTAFFGMTYGYWRYTCAVEVYIPSIFLILCSLSLIFRFLDDEERSLRSVLAAGALSGLAVLFYQPNIIVLFIAGFVLFSSKSRLLCFVQYSVAGAVVFIAGLIWSFTTVKEVAPSPMALFEFITERNGEFRERPSMGVALVKIILSFGHDFFSAHWTQTIDPIRNFLNPRIPGCVYNFQVVEYAGKGIQAFTAIAAILFLPMLFLFARIHWIAACKWKSIRIGRPGIFLATWLVIMGAIVAVIDPGSFEAWIPMLVPFSGLLTVLVIEPCYQLGRHKVVLSFLVLMLAYNFFGGMMIWRNPGGDQFLNKTAWIRTELTAEDTVLLSQFDYRLVDFLQYNSSARIVHLEGADDVMIARCHPDITTMPTEQLLRQAQNGKFRLFVLDDIISPTTDIKQCRSGEEKFAAAEALGKRLFDLAELVDENDFGKVYEIRFSD